MIREGFTTLVFMFYSTVLFTTYNNGRLHHTLCGQAHMFQSNVLYRDLSSHDLIALVYSGQVWAYVRFWYVTLVA